ncbi:hypothetical protein DIPPA_25442 [Diplonema papillatum]|nr:hypothetical protein DIPPA_25442 [Diplonema papillatum]
MVKRGGYQGGQRDMKQGDEVEVFYRFEHDGSGGGGNSYFPIRSPDAGLLSPRLGFTVSWQAGIVIDDFSIAKYNPKDRQTWVKVQMSHTRWSNRKGTPLDLSDPHNTTVMFPPTDVRLPAPLERPKLSFFVIRWGGPYPVPEHSDDGEFGGWGDIGTCICDKYITTFFNVVHEKLGPIYEVLTCFVSHSADFGRIFAPGIAGMLSGEKKAGMYYVWPVSWLDMNEGQPGYVERSKFFEAMRGIESSGIPTKHPHPSNMYHLFASKSWTASMCLSKEFHVPCTTKVNRASVLDNPAAAATQALNALLLLQNQKYGTPLTTNTNEMSGVAKLGFSWEAQDVLAFSNAAQLAQRLERLLEQAGCTGDCIYVQEQVPNDCEIRIYLIDGKPMKTLYSRFSSVDNGGSFSSFRRIEDRNIVLREWFSGNEAALRDAESKILELKNLWLVWLRAECSEPPPCMRMDFFVKLHGTTATVTTGELTEQGASLLGWKEGPDLTFNAVLRNCLGTAPEHFNVSDMPPAQKRKTSGHK